MGCQTRAAQACAYGTKALAVPPIHTSAQPPGAGCVGGSSRGFWEGTQAFLTTGAATHMVVDEQLDPFLWVVEGLEPLEELAEERGGLLDKDANQDEWQGVLLRSGGSGETKGRCMEGTKIKRDVLFTACCLLLRFSLRK